MESGSGDFNYSSETLNVSGSGGTGLDTVYYMEDPEEMSMWRHPLFLHITLTHTVTFVVGLIVNIIAMSVMIGDRKNRTTTRMFLTSLTVADLLLLVVCIPIEMLQYFVAIDDNGYTCKLAKYTEFLSAMASVLNLCAVSFERVIVIVFPMRSRSICTMRNCRRTICCVWILAMLLALPAMIIVDGYTMTYTNYKIYVRKYYCIENVVSLPYVVYQVLILFLIPGLFLAICYAYVIRELWKSTRTITMLTNASSLGGASRTNTGTSNRMSTVEEESTYNTTISRMHRRNTCISEVPATTDIGENFGNDITNAVPLTTMWTYKGSLKANAMKPALSNFQMSGHHTYSLNFGIERAGLDSSKENAFGSMSKTDTASEMNGKGGSADLIGVNFNTIGIGSSPEPANIPGGGGGENLDIFTENDSLRLGILPNDNTKCASNNDDGNIHFSLGENPERSFLMDNGLEDDKTLIESCDRADMRNDICSNRKIENINRERFMDDLNTIDKADLKRRSVSHEHLRPSKYRTFGSRSQPMDINQDTALKRTKSRIENLFHKKSIRTNQQIKAEEAKNARKQVILMLILVIILYLVCWGPKIILVVIVKMCSSHENCTYLYTPNWFNIKMFCNLIPYVHSCMNPFIYSFMSKNFKRSMRRQLNRLSHSCGCDWFSSKTADMPQAFRSHDRERTRTAIATPSGHLRNESTFNL